MSTPDAPKKIPALIGRYAIVEKIARGGMGTVYRARIDGEQGFGRSFAIKTIEGDTASDSAFRAAFAREARLAAQLAHPNVCQVFDYGEHDGSPFLAMEYLEGRALHELLSDCGHANTRIPFAVAARIVADAARGLHAAHELRAPDGTPLGVVHRDVSPQNLFVLSSGITKVIDFGIARSLDAAAERTQTGVIKGKFAYMAPEQASAKPVDRRADVFSLGVVLWEALTQRRLFRAENDASTLRMLLFEPTPTARSAYAGVPAELDRIAMKALEREADARYDTAERMARELEQWLGREAHGAGASEVTAFLESVPRRSTSGSKLLSNPQLESPPEAAPPPAENAPASVPASGSADGPAALALADAPLPNARPPWELRSAPKLDAAALPMPDFDGPLIATAPTADGAVAPAPAATPIELRDEPLAPRRRPGRDGVIDVPLENAPREAPSREATRAPIQKFRYQPGPGFPTLLAIIVVLFFFTGYMGIFRPGRYVLAAILTTFMGAQRAAAVFPKTRNDPSATGANGAAGGTNDDPSNPNSDPSAHLIMHSPGDPLTVTGPGAPHVVDTRRRNGRLRITDEDVSRVRLYPVAPSATTQPQ